MRTSAFVGLLLGSAAIVSIAAAQNPVGPLTPSMMGKPGGPAHLDSGGHLPQSQLPNILAAQLSVNETDYSVGLTRLCAAGSGDLDIALPAGTFTFLSTVTNCGGRNMHLHGAGEGMTNIVSGGADIMLDMTQTSVNQTVELDNFSAYSTALSGSLALLRVTHPLVSSHLRPTELLHDINIVSSADPGAAASFCKGFILYGSWLVDVSRVTMIGADVQPAPTGCSMVDAGETIEVTFTRAEQTYGDSLLYQSGYMEGVRFNSPSVVGTNYLFSQATAGIVSRGGPVNLWLNGLYVNNAEIATYAGGLKFQHAHIGGFMSNNHWNRWGLGANTWTGYDLQDVQDLTAIGDVFEGGVHPETITAIKLTAGGVSTSTNTWVAPRIELGATAVAFGAGTVYNSVLNAQLDPGLTVSDLGMGNIITRRTFSGANQIYGNGDTLAADGAFMAGLDNVPGAANYIRQTPALTGGGPILSFTGSDANVGGIVQTKGLGGITVQSDSGRPLLQIHAQNGNSQVNYLAAVTAQSGNGPTLAFTGADADVGGVIQTKGGGGLTLLNDANGILFQVHKQDALRIANYLTAQPSSAGNAPALQFTGSDASVNAQILAKGLGSFILGNDTGSVSLLIQPQGASPQVNYLQLNSAPTGGAVILNPAGFDANIPLVVQPKGVSPLVVVGIPACAAALAGWLCNNGTSVQVK